MFQTLSRDHVTFHLPTVGYSQSSFDTVLCGIVDPPSVTHSAQLLEEVTRLLKPTGQIIVREPVCINGKR